MIRTTHARERGRGRRCNKNVTKSERFPHFPSFFALFCLFPENKSKFFQFVNVPCRCVERRFSQMSVTFFKKTCIKCCKNQNKCIIFAIERCRQRSEACRTALLDGTRSLKYVSEYAHDNARTIIQCWFNVPLTTYWNDLGRVECSLPKSQC